MFLNRTWSCSNGLTILGFGCMGLPIWRVYTNVPKNDTGDWSQTIILYESVHGGMRVLAWLPRKLKTSHVFLKSKEAGFQFHLSCEPKV